MKRYKVLTVLLLVLFPATSLLAATVDVQPLKKLQLDSEPRQVVSTPDGRRLYVLTETGEVKLFSVGGQLLGSFQAGPDVTGITPQGTDRLILTHSAQKQLSIVNLELSQDVNLEGAPFMGNIDAPVAIAVFDDFECPYCAKAAPLLKQVQETYPEQVKLVFKNFPLGMHRNAKPAALAGLAADRQGKFWELHDLLFEHYNRLNPQKITELARQAGLDMDQFEKDRKDPQLAKQVQDDFREGQKIGVRGTPTIFINGRRLNDRSAAGFSRMIEAELARVEAATPPATGSAPLTQE